MDLTLIHPSVGRRPGESYIGTWQMEPLPAATIAGLPLKDAAISFFDDRLEDIPYDRPTDLVAISIETYTAKRSYQIASEYRRRGVPVVMGGFHATLCPDEVAGYAEAVIVGEAEELWQEVIDDARHGSLKKFYRCTARPSLAGLTPDRSIFRGKRYLPIGLVEWGRGCPCGCDFCSIQTAFHRSRTCRPADNVLREIRKVWSDKKVIFFVDDNLTADMAQAKEFLRALIPLKIKWVGQVSIHAAHDEEFLVLLQQSGCQCVLIGFESLNPENLKSMNKGFNTMKGGYEQALANLRRYRIRLYITFVFGYDHDTSASFFESVQFARRHRFFIAAFNHLTPFPGTPLYARLKQDKRLLYDSWWLDETYSYNKIPFQPVHLEPDELQRRCVEARREFYSWPSILQRSMDPVNRGGLSMFGNFFLINSMLRSEVTKRDFYPLGDAGWRGELLKAN